MATFQRVLIVFLLLASVPMPAAARCEGAVVLGALHDAYRATLTERGAAQIQAATSLLFMAGGQDSITFARQVSRSGVDVSAERLRDILVDAQQIATDTLEGRQSGDPDFRHGPNVQWLADTFIASRCQNSVATTSRTNVEVAPKRSERSSILEMPKKSQYILLGIAVIAGLLSLLGLRMFLNSFAMRRRRVERFPRQPILLPVKVTYAFPDGEERKLDVEAADISLGGMKLSWPQPPGPGTPVTVITSDRTMSAQITWSNSFFAGIMFDEQITEEELDGFLSKTQPQPA